MSAILEIAGLHRAFGGVRAVDGVDLALAEPGIVGLIGPNGAGKTTLFDLIAGQQEADRGEIRFQGRRIEALPVQDRARLGFARTSRSAACCREETCLDQPALRRPGPAAGRHPGPGVDPPAQCRRGGADGGDAPARPGQPDRLRR